MFETLSIPALAAVFALAALVVLALGTRMARLADRIADRTGVGEALVGGVLLGAATSLSGTVVSFTAALDGYASLAFSNAVGGIAAQTAFLAVADLTHRRANLEHVSAEPASLFQAALLLALLTVPFIAYTLPPVTVLGLHPASLILLAGYVLGLRAAQQVRAQPMWRPVLTPDTRADEAEESADAGAARAIVLRFVLMMGLLGLAGWAIAQSGEALSTRLGLSQTVVGVLMTAVATSLPELVTTLAAVRRGAMQLALGGIIGGNTFDTLFLLLADAGYRPGSLYHAVGPGDLAWLAVGMLMTAILLMGLVLRERRGPFSIGSESVLILAIYAGAVALQIVQG